jgi:hypothetical protein
MGAALVRAALGAGALALTGSAAMAVPQKGVHNNQPSGKVETRKGLPPTAAASPGVTYALKDLIKAKAGEFCAPYGGGNCIQEVEICLAMVDRDGDPVRLCVNSTPEGKSETRDRPARAASIRQ